MDKYWLLNNYRKKLAVFFSVFVLFSIWSIVAIYETSHFLASEASDKNALLDKQKQIVNVIQNGDIYADIQEVTFRKILTRVFSDTTLFVWANKVIAQIPDDEFENFSLEKDRFQNKWGYKYYMQEYYENWNKYKVITRKIQKNNTDDAIRSFLYFLLFSLPFSIVFYFLGYFFVGKNLRPIKQTIRNLEDFTGNVNHEFRTPLSEIVSSLELAKRNGKYKTSVDNSISASKRLTKILDSLTGIVSITDSQYKKQKIDLVRYSKQIMRSYEKKCTEKDITPLFISYTKQNYTKINKEHFYTCFSNILSNAIKYSEWNSKIYVRLKNNVLEIEDEGVWIGKKNLKKIFDRYFREDYNDQEWIGIGLALVKKIADVNKWKIDIESKKGQWTKVILDFS